MFKNGVESPIIFNGRMMKTISQAHLIQRIVGFPNLKNGQIKMDVLNRLFLVMLILVMTACDNQGKKESLTDLMGAVMAEDVNLVKQLLDNQVDVNERTSTSRYTALMYASGAHLHDSERQLIELGISVPSLETRKQILRLLLNKGADPNLQLLTGWRALIFAIYHGRTVSVKDLLEAGAEVNFLDRQGDDWSPLMLATYHCYLDIVELLLSHGADPKLSNSFSRNAKTIASEECPEALKLFEKN